MLQLIALIYLLGIGFTALWITVEVILARESGIMYALPVILIFSTLWPLFWLMKFNDR